MIENSGDVPNKNFFYPLRAIISPRTQPSDLHTSKPEKTKWINGQGDEFFHIDKFGPEQSLLVSLLAGSEKEKPIVPCSSISAVKVDRQWEYYSHKTVKEDFERMSLEDAIACEMLLYFVCSDTDHDVLEKENVQVFGESDAAEVNVCFHDFHVFGSRFFNDATIVTKDIIDSHIGYYVIELGMRIDTEKVRADLLERAKRLRKLCEASPEHNRIYTILDSDNSAFSEHFPNMSRDGIAEKIKMMFLEKIARIEQVLSLA